jgi:4-hydroxythreonine-4-phosphate dehydrogenase
VLPLIAISMGDPGGIGPEVVARALADAELRQRARWVVLGPASAFEGAARLAGVALAYDDLPMAALATSRVAPTRAGEVALIDVGGAEVCAGAWGGAYPARDDAVNGGVSLRAVREAIALAKLEDAHPWRAHAVATAPISKRAWHLAGEARYPGHTELFAEEFASEDAAMFFHAPPARGGGAGDAGGAGGVTRGSGLGASSAGINVILASVHQPLMSVGASLTSERIARVIALGAEAMVRLGVARPRVGVCGLNPHAGEGGLLGEEDERVIAPAVARARAAGIDASGPHPADTIFQRALWGRDAAGAAVAPSRYDVVVAMYHDQGLIPVKLLAWDRAVNMTVGLGWRGAPIFRTSPDHGTAFDIAGRGLADGGSMRAACGLAVAMASRGG